MSYIDRNLLPDETIVFRTKKHMVVFMVPLIFLAVAVFFSLDNALTNHMNQTLNFVTRTIPLLNTVHRLPALIFLLLSVYSGIQQWIIYQFSDYVVTTKRVVMREGLLLRRTSDLLLSTISSVGIDQGVLAQMLNYGNVIINGFGGQKDNFIQVAAPAAFQRAVHSQIDQYKR